ncbi:MAG: hypothetical protein DRN30_05505, partial [Thermoplasmata archaeon]
VAFRAIVHATEDMNKVIKALKNVLGEDIEISVSRTKGYFGNEIIILHGEISKKKQVEEILKRILEPEANKNYVLATLEERIDERYHLYLRLDKQEAYKGNIVVSEGDDVISLIFSFNIYPKKKEILIKWIKSIAGEHS